MSAALEDVKAIVLEEWKTLNTAASPTKIDQGQTPDAKNVWVDEKPGSVITANGYILVGTVPSGSPAPFCIDYFKGSTGTHEFIVSDNETVWSTKDFQNFTSLITGLSGSFQLRGLIIRDKLWLTNGSDSVRTYDGTIVVVLDGSGGTPDVPKGRYIAYHDERIWMLHTPSARSGAFFTALTDSAGTIITPDDAAAWPSDNELQIAEGDADFGTSLFLYRGSLHFSKQYSIYRLAGFDEYTYQPIRTRASTGTRFHESVGLLDGLIQLIGTDGLYTFNGDETVRISDIIDPASASQTAFGFNQLQQPNTNVSFWETINTADWNAGAVPLNAVVDDSITISPVDTSQVDFAAGTTKTNLTTSDNPGSLQLELSVTGASTLNLVSGAVPVVTMDAAEAQIGNATSLTDGDLVNAFGFSGVNTGQVRVPFNIVNVPALVPVTTVVLKGLIPGLSSGGIRFYDGANNIVTPTSVTAPATILVDSVQFTSSATPQDYTLVFPLFTTNAIKLQIQSSSGLVMTELQVFTTAYKVPGQFISKAVDYGAIPNGYGTFNADCDLNGQSLTFYTQSSADGSIWDAAVAVTNGGIIGSVVKRYLRWRADFNTTGTTTPVIRSAYLPMIYFSPVHNTGGNIFSWGPFESDYSLKGQSIRFYYRSATLSAAVSGATWNLIVPGGVVNDPVANQFIQFKIEVAGGTATNLPVVENVTINWVVGTGTQPNTFQNVASAVWRNRYWLSAAGPSATENDTILVRGKKTFGSPWQLKDWSIASFTRYFDGLYGCSSVDGAIYRLDTGYSKAGSAMDSYFETGDFIQAGFDMTIREIMIEVERTGSYNLTVGISIDRGISWTDKTVALTVTSGKPSYMKQLNFRESSDQFRVRVRTNGVDEPFQVHRLIIYYALSQTRGSIN